jgi:hypothetical protein
VSTCKSLSLSKKRMPVVFSRSLRFSVSPLYCSSIANHREVCELLISCGAELNARSNEYAAPAWLHFLKITQSILFQLFHLIIARCRARNL